MLISFKWSSIFLSILKKTIWFIVPIEIAFDGDFGSCILFTFKAIEDISPSQLDNANLIFSPIKNKGCYFLCSKDGLSLQKRWKQLGTKLRHHTNLMTPSRAKKFAWWLMFILNTDVMTPNKLQSGEQGPENAVNIKPFSKSCDSFQYNNHLLVLFKSLINSKRWIVKLVLHSYCFAFKFYQQPFERFKQQAFWELSTLITRLLKDFNFNQQLF